MIQLKNIELHIHEAELLMTCTAYDNIRGMWHVEADLTLVQSKRELIIRQHRIDCKPPAMHLDSHKEVIAEFNEALEAFAKASHWRVQDYFGQLLMNC